MEFHTNSNHLPFGLVENRDSAENDKAAVVVAGGKGVANVVFIEAVVFKLAGGGVDFCIELLIDVFTIDTSVWIVLFGHEDVGMGRGNDILLVIFELGILCAIAILLVVTLDTDKELMSLNKGFYDIKYNINLILQ